MRTLLPVIIEAQHGAIAAILQYQQIRNVLIDLFKIRMKSEILLKPGFLAIFKTEPL